MKKYSPVIIALLFTILFAEKVSLNEIENVAINYYRQNVVPKQIKEGIINDYNNAVNLVSIEFEIDSLVVDGLTLSYYFNYKPIGYIAVNAVNSVVPVPRCCPKDHIDIQKLYKDKDDPGFRFDKNNYVYKEYYNKPTKETLKKWNKYKVDPKDFKIKIPYKAEKVSLHDATNVAINHYRELFIRKKRKAINLDNLSFELDSLIYKDINFYYIFNFEPKGFVLVCSYTSMFPIYDMGVNEYFDKQAHLNNKERVEFEFRIFNKHYFLKPKTRKDMINQWQKLNVNPKEYKSKRIKRE
jgi:hypothetical protein